MKMLTESQEFETPQPRLSMIELPGSDIQREGFLKKLKTNRKKYFVLRSTSSSGPARLEYYDSEKKLRSQQPAKRSLKLHTCFNINKKNDTRQKYAIALYTKDECFSVVADDAVEQELWLNLLLKLQNEFIPPGEMPKPHYDHVWQVTVKPKGLGLTRANICGDYRLCLSEQEICMVKKNSDKPEFTFQLSNIRKYGNTENFFFIEVGRQSPVGPGEIFMQLEDSFCAQNIHEQMLIYMRKNAAGGDQFRQRSSTSTSTLRRPLDMESQVTAARQRTCSESKKNSNPPRKSYTARPQSVTNLVPENNFAHRASAGFYANIPSTFTVPRDRSDSSSSRASSHRSLPADDGYSPEPVYENVPDISGSSSLRSTTPESVTSPISEESYNHGSSYMDMSPSQTSAAIIGDPAYLSMSPGQFTASKPAVQHARSSSLPVTSQSSVGPDTSDNPYLAMSPGQLTPDSTQSSYMAMLPGQHSKSTSLLPSQPGFNQSIPYSPPSQRVSRPETPPSQKTSRPGSSCSHDSSVNSSEGYMEMNPTEKSRSSEKVNMGPEQGYMDMTVGSSSSTSSKDGSPKLSRTAPIPIRSTKQSGYLEMGPSSQPLAPVKEGGSGEGYLPMTPQNNMYGDVELRPNKVVSYLSDDSMSGEFPKRAYSVGSRPPRKLIPQHVHHAVSKPNVSNNGRSSSAPHLIEKKLRSMIPYTQMDSSLSCSPSQSIKSSISDSDSFLDMECMRPRTSSDSFGCRPRSSSFGRGFGIVQGHRPRSSSYGTSARGKLGSYESVRLTSKELHLKHSNESLTGQISGASSSESLKKNEQLGKKSEYVDMRLDKSETPGYIDMTCNPKSVGSKSSTSSLASSPLVHGITSPHRHDSTSSPSIKIIKPSGTQKSIGFPISTPTNNSVDTIPPQSSLFSPINFVSPSGSRSPSVKGRSPASSGRESEEESYVPFQPPSYEKDKHVEHKKEKKLFHGKSKHKDKDKDKKHGQKAPDKVVVETSQRVSDCMVGVNVKDMKSDRDSMYMDYEPGVLELAVPVSTPHFTLGPEIPLPLNQSTASAVTPNNSEVSSYIEYEPETVPTSREICLEMSADVSSAPQEMDSGIQDDSSYMQYEPGVTGETGSDTAPSVPPRNIPDNTESAGSSIETLKDGESASHVEVDPYMDFDPEKETKKSSTIEAPTRVRSFITDTSMEEELAKEETTYDKRSKVTDTNRNKPLVSPPTIPSSAGETDEYVGLDFKSSESFLLGGNVPSCKTHEQLISSKSSLKEESKPENVQKKETKVKGEAKTRNYKDVFKNNVSSLEELKIEDDTFTDNAGKSRKSSSSSSKMSPSPKELTKQGSLPCMVLPADILELQIKETDEKVNYERENSQSSQTSRHSCSDLTVSYEPMNFPSDTLKSSELSGSQQLVTSPGLNYASLDLGSRENIDSDNKATVVKSRHASIADDLAPLPPNAYAQIDFKKSEILKYSGKQDKQEKNFE